MNIKITSVLFLLIGLITGIAFSSEAANNPTTGVSSATITKNTTSLYINYSKPSGVTGTVVVVSPNSAFTNPSCSGYTSLTTYNTSYTSAPTTFGGNDKVVYAGTSSTVGVTVTGLTEGTSYWIGIYTYNYAADSKYYYQCATSPYNDYYSVQTTTLDLAPSAGPNPLTMVHLGQSNTSFTWTPIAGTNSLVIVRNAADALNGPDDGTTYTANAQFGVGSSTGTGNYVVYNGSGNYVTVTGLSSASDYVAYVYSYSGSAGSQNYTYGSGVAFTTLSSVATTEASNVTTYNVDGNSAMVKWTPGTGSNRVVTIAPGYVNTSLRFDGTASYVDIPNESNFDFGSSFSVEAWIKVDNFTIAYQPIITKGDDSWRLQRDNASNQIQFGVKTSVSNYYISSISGVNDNNWHHVAGVYDGTQIQLYIDGVLENSQAASGTVYNNAYNVNIGRNAQYATRLWNGKIDEVRVWSSALSSSTLNSNMYKSVSGSSAGLKAYYKMDDGQAAASSTAINSCTNTTGIDGTLMNFSSTAVANSFASATSGWAWSGAVVNSPVDKSIYTANANYGSGSLVGSNSTYCVYNGAGSAMIFTGLAANTTYTAIVYEYNGGTGTYNNTTNYRNVQYGFVTFTTIAAEPTTAASNLTFTNTTSTSTDVSWTSGTGTRRVLAAKPCRMPTALSFDGTDDYVNLGPNSLYNQTGAFTLEAWIKADSWKTNVNEGTILSKEESGFLNNMGYVFSCGNNGSLYFAMGFGLYMYSATSDPIMKTGRWHHVAAVYDGYYLKLYIDGVEVKTAGGSSGGAQTSSVPLYLGASYSNSGRNFDGQIDEVRMWNMARSESDLRSNRTKTFYNNDSYFPYLVGYWKMDDGYMATSTVQNSSLNTNLNGTLVNFASNAAATSYTAASGWCQQGATVNAPIDGSGYTASSAFGSGTQITNGYYAVYDGTGSTASVSGLTPNTRYDFALFEYKDNGSSTTRNYLVSLGPNKEMITTALAPPVITSFTPTSGAQGSTVTINGSGFSTTAYNNIVRFGGVRATVLTASANILTVQVPSGAGLNPITVTNNNLTGYSRLSFDVTQACAGTIDASSFSISNTVAVQSGYKTNAVSLFDMDTDGKPEVTANGIYVSGNYGSVSFSRNNTTNGVINCSTPALTYGAAYGPVATAYADIDGDGDLDYLVANSGTYSVSVFPNNTYSTPVVGSKYEIPVPAAVYSIAANDMDGDGRADIIVGTSSANIYVIRNISTLTVFDFEAPFPLTFSGAGDLRNIAVGDFTNDNKPEIVVGSKSVNTVAIFANASTSGNLSFTSSAATGRISTINAISIADMNYDGKLDVAIGYNNNQFETHKNNWTSGTITLSNFSNVSGTYTGLSNSLSAIALSDLDGDNKVDVVLGYLNGSSISVYKNNTASSGGNIALATKVDYTVTTGNPVFVAANDMNADGKPDLAVASDSTFIYLFNNNINETTSEPTLQASNITFNTVTTNSMNVNLTSGNGTNRLVIAREAQAVNKTPFDAVGYTANPSFGLGTDLGDGNYVVYNGGLNSFGLTNLKSSTTYYFAIFEYNGSSTCELNYLISPTVTGSRITNNATPTLDAITNPAALCVNSGQQTINLSGIGTGAAHETQTLTVTASSSLTSLIPNPTITYTSPNATGTLKFTPVAGQTGTAVITVTVNDNQSNNNTYQKTFTVTVNGNPTTSNAGTNQDICFTTYNLQGNTPVTGTGEWAIVSTNNGLIGLSDINSPTATIGNYSIGDSTRLSWTISNPGCPSSVSYVNIKRVTCPLTANFNSDKTVTCKGTSIVYTDASVSGGTTITSYSWTFTGGTPSSATGPGPHTVTYASIGSKNVQLNITDNTSANASASGSVTVMDKPTNPSSAVSGPTPVCAGSQGISYSIAELNTLYREASYYIWSLPSGVTISAGDSTAYVDLNFATNASTGVFTVKGGNQCGESNFSPNKTVTVSPLPGTVGTITGTALVCPGQNGVSYSVPSVTAATDYNWTLPFGASIFSGSNTNSIVVNFASNAASGPISVTPSNSCGDGSASADFDVTVNTLPEVPSNMISSSGSSICEGTSSVSFDVTAGANTGDLIWSVPSGSVITFNDSSSHIVVNFPVGASSGNVSVYGKNACGNGTVLNYAVTINPLPGAATSILGSPTVCQGQTGVSFYVAPIANVDNYVWSLPSGASISGNDNSNSVLIDFASNASTGVVTVMASNACGNGTVSPSYNVTVDPLPDPAGTISGSATVCAGQDSVVYSVGTIANASIYNWILPSGANVIDGANTNTITVSFANNAVSGNIHVIGFNDCGYGDSSAAFVLTVNPLPESASAITGNNFIDICPMAGVESYSIDPVNNAANYVWTVPAGAIITNGSGTDSITVDFSNAVSGDVVVYASNGCGNGASSQLQVTVDVIPPTSLCVVTVDSVLNKNVILWDKVPAGLGVTNYNIYKETTTAGVYNVLVTIPADSLSTFTDTASYPAVRSYRYKVSALDSCNNESELSLPHKTIHLNVNLGVPPTNVNLIWENYEGFDFGSYRILRGTGLSNIAVIDTVPSSIFSYTDTNAPAADSLYYVIEMLAPQVCVPSYKMMVAGNHNSAKSNSAGIAYRTVGIRENAGMPVLSIVPNPNSGLFNLNMKLMDKQDVSLSIFSVTGQLVYEENIQNNNRTVINKTIDLTGVAQGVYTIRIQTSKGMVNQKLIIE